MRQLIGKKTSRPNSEASETLSNWGWHLKVSDWDNEYILTK